MIEDNKLDKINSSILNWIKKNKYNNELISIIPKFSMNYTRLSLSGRVLLERQKEEIEEELEKSGKWKIINNLRVMSSLSYKGNFKWGQIIKEKVDVRRQKGSIDLSTQIISEDSVFKILYNDEKESLIQLEDLTLGWVYNKEISILSSEKNYWKSIKRASKDKVIKVPALNPLFDSVKKYSGSTYRLGGKSKSGIDCSGLIQIIFKQAFNIILPKHALGQFKMGRRVSLKEIIPGDLIFARVKGKNIFHVGLVYKCGMGKKEDNDLYIIHASRHAEKVIGEPIAEFLEKYSAAGARRIVVAGKNK